MPLLDRIRLLALLPLLTLVACGGATAALDAGQGDSAVADDAAPADAAPADAAPGDGTSADAGVPLAGFGAISGSCGVLGAADLTATSPELVQDVLDFGPTAYSDADLGELSAGGQYMIAAGNLGGSSLLSEVFAYEVLYRCQLATLLKTESEIAYTDAGGKRTDFLVSIDGLKIGVSVVRAYVYPGTTPMTVAQAETEITRKLSDIILSSANVAPEDAWQKQILAVIAYGDGDAASVATAWAGLAADVKRDTIVMVTRTDGADAPLYQ